MRTKIYAAGIFIIYVAGCVFNYWLGRESTRTERDGLRTQVGALRAADGDGSCAVTSNGPRVLCALRGDRLQRTPLNDGDVVCGTVLRSQNRVECTLADGWRVTLRHETTRRRP